MSKSLWEGVLVAMNESWSESLGGGGACYVSAIGGGDIVEIWGEKERMIRRDFRIGSSDTILLENDFLSLNLQACTNIYTLQERLLALKH